MHMLLKKFQDYFMNRSKVHCMSQEGLNAYYCVVLMSGMLMVYHSSRHDLPMLHLHGVETKRCKGGCLHVDKSLIQAELKNLLPELERWMAQPDGVLTMKIELLEEQG
jgi:hypothetical protein